MNSLTFTFSESVDTNDHQVRPVIDGDDLLQTLESEFIGLDPPEFFSQDELKTGGNIILGRCTCGELGCDSFSATVRLGSEAVTWILRTDKRLKFRFAEYFQAVQDAESNFSWETVERTAERFVSEIDFSRLREHGFNFQWASARIAENTISIATMAGDGQHLFNVSWDGSQPSEARDSVEAWAKNFEPL
ncbi:MAG: hypothetical protein J5I65_16590 [Aridibacter famidurans]|nr:hypothetical protein [Aridibacter famidurans]